MQKRSVIMLMACLGLFFVQNQTQAQTNMREIGTRLQGVNNFGVVYKKQKAENRYTRYQVVVGGISYSSVDLGNFNTNNTFGASFGFGIAWEKREEIDDKLQFVHGFAPLAAIGFSDGDGNTATSIELQLGYILGAQYNFSDKLYVSLEAVPRFAFLTRQTNTVDTYDFAANFSSDLAFITLAYRFKPKK